MAYVNLRAINIVCVCVDNIPHGEIDGRLYHRFSAEPVSFSGVGELLTSMESLFNAINYPQASTEVRNFRSKRWSAEPKKAADKPTAIVDGLDVVNNHGEKATFVIQVLYRQNASWQGLIRWVEYDVTQEFRSALEFLKLIDSCVDELESVDKG